MFSLPRVRSRTADYDSPFLLKSNRQGLLSILGKMHLPLVEMVTFRARTLDFPFAKAPVSFDASPGRIVSTLLLCEENIS